MHLTADDLGFLARLSKSPDGRRLVMLLQAKLKEREQKLRRSTGEEVHRDQGRALELDELIADIEQAEQKLTRSASPVTSQARRVVQSLDSLDH